VVSFQRKWRALKQSVTTAQAARRMSSPTLQTLREPIFSCFALRWRHSRQAPKPNPVFTWSVYMPLPSAWKLITVRSGHATAAPTAMGGPMPMLPPVSERCENGGAPAEASQ
jgi:hypothetical protein